MSKILYKFRKIDKYAFDILFNKRLYLSSWEILNDPREAEMVIDVDNRYLRVHGNPHTINELDQKYLNWEIITDNELINPRICSLSSIWSSNLLWSNYADGHNGIAIGIFLPRIDNSIRAVKINYDDRVPRITQFPLKKEDLLNTLSQKSREWEYEQEVCLISFNPERSYIENIEIKEIIFGLRTNIDDKNLIHNIVNHTNTDVKFFRTCMKPDSYVLDKSEVSYLHGKLY